MPPSVRFWQRRVYWSPVFILVTALRQGRNPAVTLERLKGLCGVWRSTVKRWQRYFQHLFPHSDGYRRLAERLLLPGASNRLPRALILRFAQVYHHPETALAFCLKALAAGP